MGHQFSVCLIISLIKIGMVAFCLGATDIPSVMLELSKSTPNMHELLLSIADFNTIKLQSATKKIDLRSETFCPGYIYIQISRDLPPSTTHTTFAVGVRSGICVVDESHSYTLHLTCSSCPFMASNVIVTYYSDTICDEILNSSVLTDFQRDGLFSSEDGDSMAQLNIRGRVSLGEELRLDFTAVVVRCVLCMIVGHLT
jgi:hypothetical protein